MGDYPTLEWVPASGGEHPPNSIRAGLEAGEKVYVARAEHEGALIPGKLHHGHATAYIPYDMEEVPKEDYEVLVGPTAALSWVEVFDGQIPQHAVLGGNDENGEPLYIGRVISNGTVTVGKVHPSQGCCCATYEGAGQEYEEYEVLVKNKLGQYLE